MRRDELAFQRQMAIHSAQSVSNRTFGGQLTSSDAVAARAPNAAAPPTVTAPRATTTNPVPGLNDLSISRDSQPPLLTAQDQARALRHSAVTERASTLLSGSTSKLATFRNTVSSYRSNAITASSLIDSFFALFDTSSAELGTLVKELADIFEAPTKRDALLKAWNDWKAINEDYPSLPGLPGGGASSSSTGSGGKRILKLKTSTAQSSRSAVNQQAGWGSLAGKVATAAPAGPSRPNRNGAASHYFPNLPSANPNRVGAGKVTTTPWATAPTRTSTTSTPAVSRPASTVPPSTSSRGRNGGGASGADFPGLPPAQKPGMNATRPGYFGNPVLKSRSGASTPAASAWGAGGVSGMVSPPEPVDDAGAGGKGKGKKKQTLIHWG